MLKITFVEGWRSPRKAEIAGSPLAGSAKIKCLESWKFEIVLAEALTNGYCASPIIAGSCPLPNACQNCAQERNRELTQQLERWSALTV